MKLRKLKTIFTYNLNEMVKDKNSEHKTMIFFWPRSIFIDVEWKKDPGAIPLGFTKLGYKVTLIVGKMESTNIPPSIKVIELDPNNSYLYELAEKFNNPKYIIKYKKLRSLIYSIKESVKALKVFIREDPSIILIEHNTLSSFISVIIYKFLIFFKTKIFMKKKGNEKRFLIKLDIDPEDIKRDPKNKGIKEFLFYFFLLFLLIFDKIIVESSCTYNELSKLNFSQKLLKKLVVIPNGCNTKDNKINKYIRKKIILSVGRITAQKGFDILIKSFQKVHMSHSDWQLRVVGPVGDQAYYDQLKNLIKSYNLEASVFFTGGLYGDDLENEYNNASIFALLSRWESYGIVRNEAIAHELPLITSEAGCGIYFKNYGSIVVPIENIEKSAEAMLKLIENPELREKISKSQLSAIITYDEVARKIENISKL